MLAIKMSSLLFIWLYFILRNIYGLKEQRSCNMSTVVSVMHFYAFSLEGHLSFDSSRQGNEAISSFIELRQNIIMT